MGRRSCAGKKEEAAALNYKNPPIAYKRVKGLLHDGFFFLAVVRQMISYVLIINCNFEDFIKI